MTSFLSNFEYYEDVKKVSPELSVLTAVRENTAARINPYEAPKSKQVNIFQNLFESLHNEDIGSLNKQLKRLDMNCRKFKSVDNILVIFPKFKKDVHVTFFWRIGSIKIPGSPETYNNPVDPLILESPHEGFDNVSLMTSEAFSKTRARAMILNAVHSHSGSKKKDGKYEGDGAHDRSTLFFKAHCKLVQMYPHAFYVQIHGMIKHSNMKLLIVNGFNSNFTTERKSGAMMFAKELPNFFLRDMCENFSICSDIQGSAFGTSLSKIFRRPTGCHNTNVEGRQLSDKKDSGRFMHIELGPQFRTGTDEARSKIIGALNATMKEWVSDNAKYVDLNIDEIPEENDDPLDGCSEEECEDCGECVD